MEGSYSPTSLGYVRLTQAAEMEAMVQKVQIYKQFKEGVKSIMTVKECRGKFQIRFEIGWLLEFYILAISKVISVRVPTCDLHALMVNL